MPFDAKDFKLSGPALPEPFVRLQLEDVLKKQKLLPAAKQLKTDWDYYRRHLRRLGEMGGSRRVKNHVLEPLVEMLGYAAIEQAGEVETREGPEDGGFLMKTADGTGVLRCWTAGVNTDLDAPTRRGRAFRFSLQNIALRVLWKMGERAGLITDGDELRLIIVNPSGRESSVTFDLTRSGWRGSPSAPDSFRLFLSLAQPAGIAFIPDLTEKARLAQAEVTKTLRDQARNAITDFLQGVLQHHQNRDLVTTFPIRYVKKQRLDGSREYADIEDTAALAQRLWCEGLVIVYRLLFILKLESSPDPARAFSFASTSLWRNTYSPNTALSSWVKVVLDERKDTGTLMEDGLRSLFRLFVRGLKSSELHVSPLGGQLFGPDTTPLLDQLAWGEQSVALLLQHLLWTPETKKSPRMRVHYGYLDVEDLGRVYEALLEREPGIATERMCRLKRDKLEVVVPYAQGEAYRTATTKSKVEWVEEIPAGRFYLRVGLGRKSSGSYYTPDAFVKFLVQETLGPLSTERSPLDDPHPAALLTIKVLDPAMGSGHFLVEACRFLGERLYEACRRCDELALALNAAADAKEQGKRIEDRTVLGELDAALLDLTPAELRARADELYQRVQVLPDPNDILLTYLPSRVTEGGETSGVSVWKARALCRRLVAVHCLYGVDKNPLAVELAKLVLWLESYSEGYPLTFLNHRLVQGDSLTGPFFHHLTTHPLGGDNLLSANLEEALGQTIQQALAEVRDLEASVGKDVADLEQKELAEQRLRARLAPLNALAAAWSGGVMLGKDYDGDIDNAYDEAAQAVAGGFNLGHAQDPLKNLREQNPVLDEMVATGREGVAYDLRFPEVFWRDGELGNRAGFDVVLGNPPWNKSNVEMQEFMGGVDFRFLSRESQEDFDTLVDEYRNTQVWKELEFTQAADAQTMRAGQSLTPISVPQGGGFGSGHSDVFAAFMEKSNETLRNSGAFGMVIPSALHVSKSLKELRRVIFDENEVLAYYCFENKNDLFDIHKSWKFSPLVYLKKSRERETFSAQFYLHDLSYLFSDDKQPQPLDYSFSLVRSFDPETFIFSEFTERASVECLKSIMSKSLSWIKFSELTGWRLRRELNPTDDKWMIKQHPDVPPFLGFDSSHLVFHLPGTMHQYTDGWEGPSHRALVAVADLTRKRMVLRACRHYRAAYRTTGRATDERTSIYAVLPPLTTATNNLPIEGSPDKRSNALSLASVAVCNSFAFDFVLRLRVGSKSISKFIMATAPLPTPERLMELRLLAHSALRLSCNHAGYEPLWREQLCYTPELEGTWREERPPFTWPVLEGDDARWRVRAAIDAVVAQAYGLTREQYEHILASFSHRSYPAAKMMCLAAWDELHALGLDAFTKKHDPYHDIPLNEALPKPVITLPGLTDLDSAEEDEAEVIELTEMMDDDEGGEEVTHPAARGRGKGKGVPIPAGPSEPWRIEYQYVSMGGEGRYMQFGSPSGGPEFGPHRNPGGRPPLDLIHVDHTGAATFGVREREPGWKLDGSPLEKLASLLTRHKVFTVPEGFAGSNALDAQQHELATMIGDRTWTWNWMIIGDEDKGALPLQAFVAELTKLASKAVAERWALEWRVVPAKELGIGGLQAAADFLQLPMVTPPKAIRLTSDGQVFTGKPTAAGINDLKPARKLTKEEQAKVRAVLPDLLGSRQGKLSDVSNADPEAGIFVLSASLGRQKKEWFALEGEWNSPAPVKDAASFIEKIAEDVAEVR